MPVDYTNKIDSYLQRLFPITRSITGNGNRETLKILQEIIPLTIKEYETGTKVFDWTIPEEWNIRDAWIKNSKGNKIVDFKNSNLHIVNYSRPVNKKIKSSTLKDHLHYIKKLPDTIPYRTSYYNDNWGFCLSFNDYKKHFNNKKNEEYEVFIDSELKKGSLTIGELLIKGTSKKEHLISTYICHPSLANDNLSGVILTAFLVKELLKKKLNFCYRIVFVPETIGAIAYCANNKKDIKNIECGLIISTVGGPGKFGYKQSLNKNHHINKIIEEVFREEELDFTTYPFELGSDERQYSSPGFRIQMPSIVKDKYYEYDYYHTSSDDLNFVKPEYINHSLNIYLKVIEKLDRNLTYLTRNLYCEPMLSSYGLYPKEGGGMLPGQKNTEIFDATLNVLFYSDGNNSLLDISDKCKISIDTLYKAAGILERKQLIKKL